MRYIPATSEEIQEMLSVIGMKSLDELFDCIPERFRLKELLDLPPAMSEWELSRHMNALAEKNRGQHFTSFLGGGAYSHFAPAVVDALISRSEFSTAYTPYQPEVSQGTLQAIYEFQTLVCDLLQMDVANASMYEGASALAEACLMADRSFRKRKSNRVLMCEAIHPEYRFTVRSYLNAMDLEIVNIPATPEGGSDFAKMAEEAEAGALALLVQSPNYFGVIEDLRAASKIAKDSGARFVAASTEPTSFGLLEPPGAFGADIVVAEGQAFGLPLSYGGPYAGLFATRQEFVRSMPGRLAGRTVDLDDNEGYVLTLSTREQHIRRFKATSNICTNQGLCALAITIFMSLLGKEGLRSLARRNLSNATYLKRAIAALPGMEIAFAGPTFNEFVVRSSYIPVPELLSRLESHEILGGIPLGSDYPDLEDCFLVTATETSSRNDMDHLIQALGKEGQA